MIGALYNNASQIVNTNATVDSVGTGGAGTILSRFTAATVRVYGPGGAGAIITITKQDGVSFTMPGASFGGCQLATWYFVMYSAMQQTCYLVTSVSAKQTAVGIGDIFLGSVQTQAASSGSWTSIRQNPWPVYVF